MTLKNRYKESIRPKLLKDLGLKNIHQVPKVVKVNVNRGLGEAASNSKALEASLNEMATITGQKALVTRAKKAIAGFKIREGMPIGCTVTLRGDRMYSFLERFINLALPRIRDFRGVNPKSFDGRGNYTVGVKEQLIFPEISFDKIDSIRGMDITIVTSAKSDQIRNASQKKHTTTTIPGSKMSLSIAKVLQKEGFISDINEEGEGYKSQIILGLKYSGKNKFPTIRSMQRVSKPGLRIYKNTRGLPKVLGGLGVAIISTSKGVMSDRDARKQGIGGEVLCYVY